MLTYLQVNTKLPQVGELLVKRLIVSFRKSYKRNDKAVCLSTTTFLAHLINQQVAHEMLAAQILLLLLNKPTDDSVEIAVGLCKEVGSHLEAFNSQIALAVFDQFRSILHEADIDKRVQYMIEVLFQIRKDRYKDNPAVRDELDLVEEEDQITHNLGLDDEIDVQDGLNIFKYDAEFEQNEAAYRRLKAEILGEDEGSEEDEDASDVSSEEDEEEAVKDREVDIQDRSNTDLVNLRRTIYLTIMSSGGFEEATHKLLRVNLPSGLEHELPSMLLECASQERTYNKFFGLIGERLCKLNRMWTTLFEEAFQKYYDTIHRYETNRLRILAQMFGHLFSSDAIGWHALGAIHLNEDETTSSSRIFIKILFEELAQGMGMKKLQERCRDDMLAPALANVFPTDNPRNTRFSINFFTAIGMGALTEGMREWLKNMPKPAPPALPAREPTPSDKSSSRSSYSSYSSRSPSHSRSRSPSRTRARGRSYSRSPPRRSVRGRSYTPSRSPTPPRRRARSYSSSRSRSPPLRRTRRDSRSPSYSRSPPRRSARSARSPSRDSRGRSYTRSRTPPRKNTHRGRSYSRSPTPPRGGRARSYSRSPPPPRGAAGRARSYTRSRTPPRRAARRSLTPSDRSRSRSRTPPRREAARRSPSRSRSRSPERRRRSASSPEMSTSPPPRRRRRRNTSSVSR